MSIIATPPLWGENLRPGFCGFITREHDFDGDGIAYFERFQTGIPFVHTFVVERGAGSSAFIIEAHPRLGVHRAALAEYCGGQNCQCFIRLPQGWTPDIGAQIVAAASANLGQKYGFGLILADLLANTWLGRGLDWCTHDAWDRLLCAVLDDQHKKICSQLVAVALQSQMSLRLRGCLRRSADTIMPRELGNDPSIWDPRIYKIS